VTIRYDLPFEEYAALPGWNWSCIKLLEDGSPLHVRHARDNPSPDTANRAVLRAIHAMVLEPETFALRYSVFDGVRRGKAYDAHVEAHPGTTVLKPSDLDLVRATADSITNHPAVRDLLAEGRPEVSLTWEDSATGLLCKGRIDWLGAALVDLKTSGSTNEREVASRVAHNLWHGQMAHYDDGLRANGIEVPAFIVVSEGRAPFDVAVFEVDEGIPDGTMHVGRELRKRLMKRLAECERLNHWPGRHPERQVLTLPAFALLDESESITFGEGVPRADLEEAV
jgi:hypothetical protein